MEESAGQVLICNPEYLMSNLSTIGPVAGVNFGPSNGTYV